MTPEMSSSGRWGRYSVRSVLPPLRHSLRSSYRLIIPNQEWATFLLILLATLSVTWSVQSAQWAQAPDLAYVVTAGLVTGLVMAKLRLPAPLLQALGLATGFLTVLWLLGRFVDGSDWSHGVRVLQERLKLWYMAATTDGMSTDTLPVAVFLVTLVWLLGYLCAWFSFRSGNIWVPLVVAGAGILTNLSYLPSSGQPFFILFLVFSFMAVAWMRAQEQSRTWSQQHIRHSSLLGAMGLYDALWFGVAVVLVAMLLPAGVPRPSPFKRANEYLRWPVEQLQGDFNRLFAGIPARKPLAYRLFDNTLPFQGTISLSDEVVFTLKSSRQSYWRVRSYSTYTSQGWTSGPTLTLPLARQRDNDGPPAYLKRVPVVQQVELSHSPRLLPAAGAAQESDLPMLLEVPSLPAYRVSLTDPSPVPPLPPDLEALAQRLSKATVEQREPVNEPFVRSVLPPDLELAGVLANDTGAVTGITVRRLPPPAPDVLSVRSEKRLFSSDRYTITSSVSVATEEELRQAGDDYPGWVRDLYLQLPGTLPPRVVDLAGTLTSQAGTPYDKVLALRDYLRTLPYTTTMPPPAHNADGVDHFLFNVGAGYSDYFGSATAVMLRAVGVPARLAVGYGLGEVGQDGKIVVRDKNSHAWTEVFFPSYGWVEFEATPGRQRPGAPDTTDAGDLPSGVSGLGDELPEDFLLGPLGRGRTSLPPDTGLWRGWGPWLAAGVAGAALTLLASLLLGRWLLVSQATAQGVYAKMVRLAALARMGPGRGQTPREYVRLLANGLPEIGRDLELVVDAYSRSIYSYRSLADSEQGPLMEAWRRVRRVLFLRALRRRRWRSIMLPNGEARL